MADSTHVIEIVNGLGEPAFIPLTAGKESPTLSIGRRGQWRVDGARMLDVHAYAYFDGQALFLQSTDADNAACVDGFPVGTAWTEVRPPCSIELGGARLEYREEVGRAAPPPRPPPPAPLPAAGRPPAEGGRTAQLSGSNPVVPADQPSRPFQPGAFSNQGDDGESTRVAPLDMSVSRSGSRPQTGAFAGVQQPSAMSGAFPSQFGVDPLQMPPPHMQGSGAFPMQGNMQMPGMQGMPGQSGGFPMQPPMQPMQAGGSFSQGQDGFPQGFSASGSGLGFPDQGLQQPQAPPQEQDALKKAIADFKTASPVRKLTYVIFPLALIAAGMILFTDDPPPPAKTAKPDAGAEAGALAAASGVPGTPPGTPATGLAGTAEPGLVPGPLPGEPLVAPAPEGGTAAAPAADAGAAPNASGPDAGKGNPITLERAAVDEVYKGDLAKAAETYERLAREQPQNPSYAYAARILRERLSGGAPPPGGQAPPPGQAPAPGAPPPAPAPR